MLFYDFFLKLYALKFPFSVIDSDEIELNELVITVANNEIQENAIVKSNRNKPWLVFGILYFIFVSFLLGWQCVYSIVRSIIKLDGRYFTVSIFCFMYLGQFIAGAIFYNGKYFDKTIKKLVPYHTVILIMLIVSNVISVILAIISVILLIDGFTIVNYTHLYNESEYLGKVILAIMVFTESIYTYNIFFINIAIFAIILHFQRINISKYLTKMNDIIDGNTQHIKITNIIEEFSKMQSYYGKSVANLNMIFTTITVIGLIGSYFTIINIGTSFSGIFSYINMSLFFCIEAVYIYSIRKINDTKRDIRVLIGSGTFIRKFLNKNTMNPIYADVYNDYKDIDNIYKDIGNENANDSIDLLKTITVRSIIISTENGIELDWIVLYNKLSENWAPFQLFGYDFNDTDIIQKLTFLALGISAVIRLNFKIGI